MRKGKYVVCVVNEQKIRFSNEINRDGKFVKNIEEKVVGAGIPSFAIVYKDENGEIEREKEYNEIIYYDEFQSEHQAIKACDKMNEEEFGILYIDALAKEFKVLRKIYYYFDKLKVSDKEEDKKKLKLWNKVREEANKELKEETFLGKTQMKISIIETLAKIDSQYEESIFNSDLYLAIAGEFGVSHYKNCLPTLYKNCKNKKIKLV